MLPVSEEEGALIWVKYGEDCYGKLMS